MIQFRHFPQLLNLYQLQHLCLLLPILLCINYHYDQSQLNYSSLCHFLWEYSIDPENVEDIMSIKLPTKRNGTLYYLPIISDSISQYINQKNPHKNKMLFKLILDFFNQISLKSIQQKDDNKWGYEI